MQVQLEGRTFCGCCRHGTFHKWGAPFIQPNSPSDLHFPSFASLQVPYPGFCVFPILHFSSISSFSRVPPLSRLYSSFSSLRSSVIPMSLRRDTCSAFHLIPSYSIFPSPFLFSFFPLFLFCFISFSESWHL